MSERPALTRREAQPYVAIATAVITMTPDATARAATSFTGFGNSNSLRTS